MPLSQLDIVNAERSGCPVDVEHRVAVVADVADGHRKPARIGPGRAEQNRLLRPAACAEDAAELENLDRIRHGAGMLNTHWPPSAASYARSAQAVRWRRPPPHLSPPSHSVRAPSAGRRSPAAPPRQGPTRSTRSYRQTDRARRSAGGARR